ncbi:MAG: Crp/Fnr family transcriptional regulator [Alphaproteobacteria bacterium]
MKSLSYDTLNNLALEHSGGTACCGPCPIRREGVCGALVDRDIERLSRIAHQRCFSAGQIILAEGAHAEFFGAIVTGVIKLTKTLADGRQHIVGLLFPNDFLGRAYRTENKYYAEAATEVELCCFPRVGFEKLLSECPPIEDCLFRLTLRVASFLLMIARRASEQNTEQAIQFQLPLARSDIADSLGLTIETVSRQITRLKSRGIIELVSTREVLVPDVTLLEEAANGRVHTSFD